MTARVKVGDRVALVLPAPHRIGSKWRRVTGAVTGLDDGSRPGVSVKLDRPHNGVDTCYATYDELQPATDNAEETA